MGVVNLVDYFVVIFVIFVVGKVWVLLNLCNGDFELCCIVDFVKLLLVFVDMVMFECFVWIDVLL